MSIQQSAQVAKPEILPEDLASPRSKLVYMYLDVAGTATIDDLQASLDMRKIDLLSVLNSLTSNDHVELEDGTYTVSA
jgi:predicted transcriptional regulator